MTGNRNRGQMPAPPASPELNPPVLTEPEVADVVAPVAEVEKAEKKSAPAKGIEVVAVRAGFWKKERKVIGDRFVIPDESMLGMWMKCVDPELEKKHQAAIKANMKKKKNAAF